MAKNELLKGYKKKGKIFIPPLMQFPLNKGISYVNDILPELIWIGLINDEIGYVSGTRFIENIFNITIEVSKPDHFRNYAFVSNFTELDTIQKSNLIKELQKNNLLTMLRRFLSPLILLYDDFPLSFVGNLDSNIDKQELTKRIYNSVKKHINKYETPGIILNGTIMVARIISGNLKFSSKIDLPDFNKVIDDPYSDEAQHAAGIMRSLALSEIGTLDFKGIWSKSFWNKNYELSECELMENNYAI